MMTKYYSIYIYKYQFHVIIKFLHLLSSDGSDLRIGSGSARDRPFLEGSRSIFREGPKLGIGSRSMSRIEGPDDLLEHDFLTYIWPCSCASG